MTISPIKIALAELVFVVGAAHAQGNADLEKRLLKCSAEKNSLQRLACFDELSKQLGSPIDTKALGSVGEWKVSTDTSRFDDSKSITLVLSAREAITGWLNKTYRPSLILRCREKRTEAYINFGMSPNVELGLHNQATLQFRIDKNSPFKVIASKSTDGEALFLPDAIGFSKRILGAKELLVRFVPFNASPQETSFPVEGLANAIEPLRETCKWQK